MVTGDRSQWVIGACLGVARIFNGTVEDTWCPERVKKTLGILDTHDFILVTLARTPFDETHLS